ncbi:MAG: metal-sensitive transcriptional regulator [Phycisphaerales bacterium]|jgi:DNA-binding FrmR family transcriptional regulator
MSTRGKKQGEKGGKSRNGVGAGAGEARSVGSDAACGCGCAVGRGGEAEVDRGSGRVGPGGVAHGVDAEIKRRNLAQLRRIEGQVRGVAAMVEGDRYCADVITQIAAVRASLLAVAGNVLRNHLEHCAAAAMERRGPDREAMIDEVLDLVSKVSR